MIKRRSICLFLACLLSTAYLCFAASVYLDNSYTNAGALTLLLMIPHLVILLIGIIFGWTGFLSARASFSLAAAILYSVSAALAVINALFLVPSIVLGFIGYANQKKRQIQ